MDSESLRQLVAGGESDRLEFKRTTGELRPAMESLCAFLNGSGGQVLIGVSDSGKILGQQVADSTLREVGQALQRLEPPAVIEQERIPVGNNLEVLRFAVGPGDSQPFMYDGRAWRRVGTTTQRMPAAEYEQRLLSRLHSQHRWENRVAEGFAVKELDTGEIVATVKSAIDGGRLDASITTADEVLTRLGLVVDGQVLQAAVVAFASDVLPKYPQCGLRLARFRGVTKTEFLDQNQLTGHAFDLLSEANLFIRRHLPVAGRIDPGVFDREDQPIFPPLALREALVNAFCHRDYSIPGGAVSVGIFDDRLEITSTGVLPQGITVDDLKREHTSQPRNPLLAEVFYRRGLIERWGRGTQKIVELCQAAGHPEPEFEERAGEVVVRFIAGDYTPPHRVGHDLNERQRELLQILADGGTKRFSDIYQQIQKPPAERTVREDLRLLRELGMVELSGHGAGARWKLAEQ
ncbi:ATP-binding protein [Aeoliella sp.]|uniref:ATP-binding protein n=1 Tax=Aeoliella sp. TaxID=2795800 RepID=UPI003CCBA516